MGGHNKSKSIDDLLYYDYIGNDYNSLFARFKTIPNINLLHWSTLVRKGIPLIILDE